MGVHTGEPELSAGGYYVGVDLTRGARISAGAHGGQVVLSQSTRDLVGDAFEVSDLGDSFEVVSEATDLVGVRTALQDAGIDYDSADSSFIPSVQIPLDAEGARKVFKLIDALEDSDDVQNVYANFDVSDEILAELEPVG